MYFCGLFRMRSPLTDVILSGEAGARDRTSVRGVDAVEKAIPSCWQRTGPVYGVVMIDSRTVPHPA